MFWFHFTFGGTIKAALHAHRSTEASASQHPIEPYRVFGFINYLVVKHHQKRGPPLQFCLLWFETKFVTNFSPRQPVAALDQATVVEARPTMAPKRIIRTTLDPNAWEGLCPALPAFKRPLYVATPRIGIDGCGTALDALGVRYQANNVYDLEHRYQAYLTQHLGGNVQLHLGKKDGDLCQLQLSDVERPVDLLVSGPPCPPWAGQGNHKGQHDHRADVFIVVMKVCIALIKVGDLHACCIENVKGILAKIKGSTCSFMDQILHILRVLVGSSHLAGFFILACPAENQGVPTRCSEE